MIEQIKALRNSVPVSIAVAKEILKNTSNLPEAIAEAQSVYANPVVKATGATCGEALTALEASRGDVAGAIELIGWKNDFSAKEKANRPTKTATRKAIKHSDLIYDLLATVGADDDIADFPAEAPEEIVNLIAMNTFHNLYLTDYQLLFDEYSQDQPRILEAMRAIGLLETADRFESEIAEGKQSDSSSTIYFEGEREVFGALQKYCEANLGIIHDWIHR